MDSDEMNLSQEIPYIGNLSRIGQQIDCCLIVEDRLTFKPSFRVVFEFGSLRPRPFHYNSQRIKPLDAICFCITPIRPRIALYLRRTPHPVIVV